MKEIELRKGYVALVDDDMFDWLNQWKWNITTNGYAYRIGRKSDGDRYNKHIMMHREILMVPEGLLTDHINGNRLDERRENLRTCTGYQNRTHITVRHKGASNYKGTRPDANGYWCAYIAGKNNRQEYLGYYATGEEAAIAYNRRARERFGEFAVLNPVEEREITPLLFSRRNTSGVYGVSWDKARKRWNAKLRRGKKHVHLGRYDTLGAASNAVKQYIESEEAQCKS
jgi:hypothetical protein